jgi:hypothetical protein
MGPSDVSLDCNPSDLCADTAHKAREKEYRHCHHKQPDQTWVTSQTTYDFEQQWETLFRDTTMFFSSFSFGDGRGEVKKMGHHPWDTTTYDGSTAAAFATAHSLNKAQNLVLGKGPIDSIKMGIHQITYLHMNHVTYHISAFIQNSVQPDNQVEDFPTSSKNL